MSLSDQVNVTNDTIREGRVTGFEQRSTHENEPVALKNRVVRATGSMLSEPSTLQIPKITDAPITLRSPAYSPDVYGGADANWPAGRKTSARGPQPPMVMYPYYSVTKPKVRRRPAPLGLRLFVFLLLVVFLLAVAGLEVLHTRPNTGWIRSLRNYQSFAQPQPATTQVTTFHAEPGGLTYFVPVSSYSIGINISHPCWVIVNQLGSNATLFATTLQPRNSEQFIPVTGNVSVKVAARTNSITIRAGQRVLGNVQNPVVGTTYDFVTR